ncbi:MAG: thrombospondin type 3 repeat-containing protein [Gammaproteobacteria bacterium]
MRTTLSALMGVACVFTHANELPEIFVTQATIDGGGIYTVTINQPPSPPNDVWFLSAWGVANSSAAQAETLLTGWTASVYEPLDWDAGFDFLTFTPDLPLYLFTTGIEGQTDFDSLFGLNMVRGVVYWNESYFGSPIPATSSNFTWSDGTRGDASRAGSSTGFALIASTMGDKRICTIGFEISLPLTCTPISPPDMDGDGVPDSFDNCTILANPNMERR